MKRVSRDNGITWYIVLEEDLTSYKVCTMLDYVGYSQQIFSWWHKSYCTVKEF